MKLKSIIIITLSVLAISIHAEAQTKKKDVNIKTVTFDVSMTCENCKKKIEKNIAFEKGIKDMQVSLDNKQVTLTFDTRKTNEEKIIEAFDKLGYNAVVVEEKS
ncbi:MAG: heavy-metal-associated domain-containing protein [Paludibacteraceae bacterium]